MFTDKDSLMSNLLLSIVKDFVEFERAIIKERQMGNITLDKKRDI